MFYSFRNSKITLNGTGLVATDAQINLQANISPLYIADKQHSFEYRAGDGIGGVFSCSYLLSGFDPLYSFITNETSVISGNFGGLYFRSGYLKSYNLNCSPNKTATVNADIIFFDELKGEFSPTYETATETNFLNIAYASISDPTNGNIGSISNIVDLNLSYNADIQPSYKAGDLIPFRVFYGPKEYNASLTFDNLSGDLPISGKSAGVQVTFTHPNIPSLNEIYKISGTLFQRNITTSVGDLVRSTINIRQNYVGKPPKILGMPFFGAPGSAVLITGENLGQVSSLTIGGTNAMVIPISDTEISGIVPDGVVSGLISITTLAGTDYSTGNFVPNNHPITISGISPISGLISGLVRLSGSNYYRISDVIFNTGVRSNFQVISPNLIQASVPVNAAWGPVWVVSSERNISGLSQQNFVPIPRIERFTPITGNTGETVIIQGYGFSGVTGILFNNLPNVSPFTTTFRVLSNSGISGIVPTGNFRGRITLLAQSGIRALSENDFGAYITITGLSPTSARTGTAIEILGHYFYEDVLYRIPNTSDRYLVSFGGGDITGHFARVNSTRITGLVPYNAKSGAVYLFDPDLNPYPSTGNFKLKHHPPTITSSGTQTGFFSGYAVLEGTNFFEVSSVKLSGTTGTLTIPASKISISQLGDVLAFEYPVATGDYYHTIISTPEGDVTGYSGIFIRDIPVKYNIYPSSGAIGALITFSGRNIYPDSKIYFNTTGVESTVLSSSVPTGYDSIQFYVPVLARTGLNDILLYNQNGWVTGTNALRLIESPGISGFNPTSGSFGDTTSISGSNLGNTTGVYFGTGRATTFGIIGNTGITATVPNDATTDFISLYYNGGVVRSTGIFDVLSAVPTISSFVPLSGYWQDSISIAGGNLNFTEYVLFSGATGETTVSENEFSVIGSTGITITIPNGTQTGPIKVRTDRVTVSSATNLTIIPTPNIITFTPNTGIFGANIRVSGSNLDACTFFFSNINSGRFIEANNVNVVGHTGASFTIPREIVNGPIFISGRNRLFNGTTGLFYPLPTIRAFAPNTALTGQTITISGINAGSILSNTVFATGNGNLENIVNGSTIINYNQISGNNIINPSTGFTVLTFSLNTNFAGSGALLLINSVFSTATGASGLRNSDMISGIGPQTLTGNLTITQSAPTISSFSPNKGNQNTLVTLNGFSLSKTTGVYLISGSTRSLCGLLSSGLNQITFNPPSSFAPRSGQFDVYTNFGNTISANYFTYIESPLISGIFPNELKTGDLVLISGNGIRDVSGFYLDIGTNRIYSGSFGIIQQGTVYQLSGIIPHYFENQERAATLRIVSEAGSATYPVFIHPGETKFWSNISGRNLLGASGLSIISGYGHNLHSGAILKMVVTDHSGFQYHVVNSYYQGREFRVFSWRTGG